MTDATMRHLEELFAAEIDSKIAVVRPKRDAKRMITEGLIDLRVERRRDRLGEYEITAHVLTHRGRMMYCDWASKQPLPAAPAPDARGR